VKIFLTAISLLALICNSCSSERKSVPLEKPDLEMVVINAILPRLMPEHPPCGVVPVEGEKKEEYNKRLQAFYDEIDSVGKKVEIVGVLTKLDRNFIESHKNLGDSAIVKHLFNAPNMDRVFDSTLIDTIKDIQVLTLKEPRYTIGGLADCYTLGQFNISRVGFNRDSTRAAFTYFIYDGSCTGSEGGIIGAELKNGKWRTSF
jgi:hypothetical protein